MESLYKNSQTESQKFFNALYGDMESEACLVLWTKSDKKSASFPVSQLLQAGNWAEAIQSKDDVYFEVGLQAKKPPSGSRGKSKGVIAIPGLWFDLDVAGPGHKETRIPPDLDAATRFLDGLPWRPTLLVQSGGGIHAYWLFREPWVFDHKNERIEAQELSVRFQTYLKGIAKEKHGWNLDSTHDLARLLRVPGTLNHKSSPPLPVSIIEHEDLRRYNQGDFDEYVGGIVIPTDFRTEFPGDGNWPPAAIEPILHGCSFMRHCRDDARCLPEPQWLSMLTIIGRCENSASLAHEWSSPYPKYDPRKTDSKLRHAMDDSGPHTCQFIRTVHLFSLCESCPNRGKVKSPIQLGAPKPTSNVCSLSSRNAKDDRWMAVRDLFPRTPFPWDVLPPEISESLNQLARSCATSPNALPGIALSVLSSTIGNRIMVSPKGSWEEPLIIWHADIRESGEGKTPASSALIKPLYGFQVTEKRRFDEEMAKYQVNEKRPKGEREELELPVERGYVTSDLTLEGLNEELSGHPHGGLFCDISELSALITGQNQYKARGTDRESWLKLWDGNSVRITRKSKTIFIQGPRVCLAGGIQPGVFRSVFGSRRNLFLEDGTIYRFLYVYEKSAFREQTRESWSDANRGAWEKLLLFSKTWADGISEPRVMIFSTDAQQMFLDWRNGLESKKELVPAEFVGFFPKAYAYCLRLSGAIHCLWAFRHECEPSRVLETGDLEKGIRSLEFYLGQAVDAMMTLLGMEAVAAEDGGKRPVVLAKALESVRGQVFRGRIRIADVMSAYNGIADDSDRFDKERSFGPFLREVGLQVSDGVQRVGDAVGVCLEWTQQVDEFVARNRTK